MKRYLAILLLIVVCSHNIYSQLWPKLSWYKTYNGPGNGVDIVNDMVFNNQNFYLAGRSAGPDLSQDLLVLKYSDKGDSLLELRYTAALHSWDEATSIAIDSYQNIYIVGNSTFDQSTFYALFHKYSPDGGLIFAKNFNDNLDIYSQGVKVILNSNEDAVIGYNQWYNKQAAIVSKYSSSGDFLWTITISDDTSDYSVNYLVTDQADNIYACLTQLYWDGGDLPVGRLVLVKIINSGEVIWRKNIDGESPRKLVLDKEQNIILIPHGDGKVVKFNPEGDVLWTNDYTNSTYPVTILTDIVIDSDNNIIVTGYEFGIYSWNYRTKKISPAGEDLWMNDFDSMEGLNDFAMGIAIDKEDNLYVTGSTHDQTSTGLCYTVIYSGDGEPGWIFVFDPPQSTFENAFQLFIGDSNHVYIGGDTGEPEFGPDFLAFKIAYGEGNDVEQIDNRLPENFSLSQNYPNPFNPATKIEFSIPTGDIVKIEIYDALGSFITELLNKYLLAGNYSIDFNADNLSSGVYYYRLSTGSYVQMKKAVLIK